MLYKEGVEKRRGILHLITQLLEYLKVLTEKAQARDSNQPSTLLLPLKPSSAEVTL